MTDKEIFDDIAKWCQCSKCEHKRTICYKPVRNEREEIVGYEDVQSSCPKRAPLLHKSDIDGRIGLHSIPVPTEPCEFFEQKSDHNLIDMCKLLSDNDNDLSLLFKTLNQYYRQDAEDYDKLLEEKSIEEILNIDEYY